MKSSWRRLFVLGAIIAVVGAASSAMMFSQLEPADYTFNNMTEIKSVDPAVVTGAPEGRIIRNIFEGLMRHDPQTLKPIPGAAEKVDISPDGKDYTFHIRPDARWSNGDPVTAYDFEFSLRRFLDPLTAAEYAKEAYYVVNAERYNLGGGGLRPGDKVEVELQERPEGARPLARGKLLYGTLQRIEVDGTEVPGYQADLAEQDESPSDGPATDSDESTDEDSILDRRVFYVEIEDQVRPFCVGDDRPEGTEPCKQVLLDFREVGIKALDDRRLQTILINPTHYWLDIMAFYPLFPVHRETVETLESTEWTRPENLVCNGAFTMQFRRLRDRIRLVKNEMYWDRDNVKLNIVDALAIESNTTSVNLFLTGKLDRVIDPPVETLKAIRGTERNDFNPSPYLTIYFYRLNTTHKPLDDVRVRKALSMAVDKAEIIKTATSSGETPARTLVPEGLTDYPYPAGLPYDPEQARELLAEAGYPNGEGFPKIEILYNTHQNHQTIAQLVRKQWQRNLGVQAGIRNEAWPSYLASQQALEYDVCRAGWIADFPDPYTFLDLFLSTGEQNQTGWKNRQYDDLLARSKKEVDAQVRLRLLRDAEAVLLSEAPVIPIYNYRTKNLVKPHVRGFYNNVQDVHPLRSIWIDHEFQGTNEFLENP